MIEQGGAEEVQYSYSFTPAVPPAICALDFPKLPEAVEDGRRCKDGMDDVTEAGARRVRLILQDPHLNEVWTDHLRKGPAERYFNVALDEKIQSHGLLRMSLRCTNVLIYRVWMRQPLPDLRIEAQGLAIRYDHLQVWKGVDVSLNPLQAAAASNPRPQHLYSPLKDFRRIDHCQSRKDSEHILQVVIRICCVPPKKNHRADIFRTTRTTATLSSAEWQLMNGMQLTNM